jgi:hypothetical protein
MLEPHGSHRRQIGALCTNWELNAQMGAVCSKWEPYGAVWVDVLEPCGPWWVPCGTIRELHALYGSHMMPFRLNGTVLRVPEPTRHMYIGYYK